MTSGRWFGNPTGYSQIMAEHGSIMDGYGRIWEGKGDGEMGDGCSKRM